MVASCEGGVGRCFESASSSPPALRSCPVEMGSSRLRSWVSVTSPAGLRFTPAPWPPWGPRTKPKPVLSREEGGLGKAEGGLVCSDDRNAVGGDLGMRRAWAWLWFCHELTSSSLSPKCSVSKRGNNKTDLPGLSDP